MTSDPNVEPGSLALSFKAFMDAMTARARAEAPPQNVFLAPVKGHIGDNAQELPIIGEEFDTYEHPNMQVAMEAYLSSLGCKAKLVGIVTPNRGFNQLSLLDSLTPSNWLNEGPVEYVNFHLAAGRILPCVQLGLYFIEDRDHRADSGQYF
jgi:hypothetical protein